MLEEKLESEDLDVNLMDNATKRMFKSIWEMIPTNWKKRIYMILLVVILCLILTFFTGYYAGYGSAIPTCNQYWQEVMKNTTIIW